MKPVELLPILRTFQETILVALPMALLLPMVFLVKLDGLMVVLVPTILIALQLALL